VSPAQAETALAGVLVIDKPTGLSSHDVVQRVRRTLHTRRVGHAGTLDPLASGVLVVMIGDATKLAPFLTVEDKSYAALVRLGVGTTTLDAEGEITERCALPAWLSEPGALAAGLGEALELERARTEQSPPLYSAIKVAGRAAYARARAGEQFALPPRPVVVHELELRGLTPAPRAQAAAGAALGADAVAELELTLTVGKGYYVRSLARDLGARLGLPAHLGALRRLRSGPFGIERAVALATDRAALLASMLALGAAARLALPAVELRERGTARALLGQPLERDDCVEVPAAGVPAAWFDPAGRLVAVGEHTDDGRGRVLRGFVRSEPGAPRDGGEEPTTT
jgi:tRNA pseudouridine55 synthase